MKNKSVDKFIHIKESQGLCDTWGVRNLKKKRYTFRQQCKNTWLLYNFEFYVDCIDERAGQLEYGVEAIGPDF